MSDTSKYYAIATGADTSSFKKCFAAFWFPCGASLLLVCTKYLPSWNAGFFGLLIANALFCATTACLVVSIGNKLFNDLGTAVVGATLYLLSFNIPNLQLSGLIDSGEACFMAALIWSLLEGKWYLLPAWAILGALAKETFVPFSCLFAFAWWSAQRREGKATTSELKWIVALAIIGLATVSAVHSSVSGQIKWPWDIAGQARAPVNFFVALWHFSERSLVCVRLAAPTQNLAAKIFSKPWLLASVATSIFAILLGAYSNAGGTIAHATFNIIRPTAQSLIGAPNCAAARKI